MLNVSSKIAGITRYSPVAAPKGRIPRVLLISPFKLAETTPGISMGVHRIAQFLSAHGCAKATVAETLHEFDRNWEKPNPVGRYDIVGISTYAGDQFAHAATKINYMRHDLGNALMVTGGHGMLVDHDVFFRSFPVDIAVVGPGEFPMAEICANFYRKGTLVERFGSVKGISINDGGKAYRTSPRPFTQEDFELINDPFDYTKLPIAPKGPNRIVMLRMSFSSHCPYACVYCSASGFDKARQSKMLYYPVDKIIEKLEAFVDHHIQNSSTSKIVISFSDDTLTANKERFFKILEGVDNIRKRTGADIWFMCYSRFDCLTDEFLEQAGKLGLNQLSIGVESKVPEVLAFLKPGTDHRKLESLEERVFKYGIFPQEFFIVAPPVATVETLLKTAEDMVEATKNGALVSPAFRMDPYWGAPAMNMGFMTHDIKLTKRRVPRIKRPFVLPEYFRNRNIGMDKILDKIHDVWMRLYDECEKSFKKEGTWSAVKARRVDSTLLAIAIYTVLGVKDKSMQDAQEVYDKLKSDPKAYRKLNLDKFASE